LITTKRSRPFASLREPIGFDFAGFASLREFPILPDPSDGTPIQTLCASAPLRDNQISPSKTGPKKFAIMNLKIWQPSS
jgi:hypothetical protein